MNIVFYIFLLILIPISLSAWIFLFCAFYEIILDLKQSLYYLHLEKTIAAKLGKGFIWKELDYQENKCIATVQFRGIQYKVITLKRTLLSFECLVH